MLLKVVGTLRVPFLKGISTRRVPFLMVVGTRRVPFTSSRLTMSHYALS